MSRKSHATLPMPLDDGKTDTHQAVLKALMDRMIPMPKGSVEILAPIGYNVSDTRKGDVSFKKRRNSKQQIEYYLPRERLDVLKVIASSMFENQKYYLALCQGETRVVNSILTTTIDAAELGPFLKA